MKPAGLRAVVEAAYRLSLPPTMWLEGLGRAAESALGDGCGTVAMLIDAKELQRVRLLDCATTHSTPNLDRIVEISLSNLDPKFIAASHLPSASLATEAGGMDQPGIQLWIQAFGATDVLSVLAMDASGTGVMLNVNLHRTPPMLARQSESLVQLSLHMLGAYHLRQTDLEDNDAVFQSNGDVVYASDGVREANALAELTSTVKALDRLRDTGESASDALDAYTSRVDATWSVLAHIADGKDEFVIAKRNFSPILPLPESLTLREREVLTLLLLGRLPKVVAYELGIAHSTVRVLIARALTKIGARNVDEARRMFTK